MSKRKQPAAAAAAAAAADADDDAVDDAVVVVLQPPRKRSRLIVSVTDPLATRRRNREKADKDTLCDALEDIEEFLGSDRTGSDRQRAHDSGAHAFVVDYDCMGIDPKAACFVHCGSCHLDDRPSENTRPDPGSDNYGVVCCVCINDAVDLLDRME